MICCPPVTTGSKTCWSFNKMVRKLCPVEPVCLVLHSGVEHCVTECGFAVFEAGYGVEHCGAGCGCAEFEAGC